MGVLLKYRAPMHGMKRTLTMSLSISPVRVVTSTQRLWGRKHFVSVGGPSLKGPCGKPLIPAYACLMQFLNGYVMLIK